MYPESYTSVASPSNSVVVFLKIQIPDVIKYKPHF